MKTLFKKYLLFMLASISFSLLLVIFFNFLSDPFQVYRPSSIRPDQYFLDQDRFQNAGLINHLWRDRHCCNTILLGTSHSQNFSAKMMDNVFVGHHLLNLSMSGATPAEEDFIFDRVLAVRKPERVIWEIHTTFATYSSRASEVQNPAPNKVVPAYLYNRHVYDDFPYLFSLDTIKYALKRYTQPVPLNLHKDWYHRNLQSFNKGEVLLKSSFPLPSQKRQPPLTIMADFESLEIVMKKVAAHPDITFILFFPPYSRLFYAHMATPEYEQLMAFRLALVKVTENYKNVRIYSSDLLDDRVENLDLYKDMGHYHPDIGRGLMTYITQDEGRLTTSNVMDHIRTLTDRVNSYCGRVYANCRR